jgi:hypothetical protein
MRRISLQLPAGLPTTTICSVQLWAMRID